MLANARSRIIFQLAADDAHTVARTTAGDLMAADFQRLRRHEVYAQLAIDGEVSRFASGKTLAPPLPISDPQKVREASRLRYGRLISEVEQEITRLVEGGSEDPGVVGRRPKERA